MPKKIKAIVKINIPAGGANQLLQSVLLLVHKVSRSWISVTIQ
jgi:hypothetical protein